MEPADDVGPRAVRAPLPEAELADQRDQLRVGVLRPVAEVVLDHAAPERDPAEDGGTARPAQQVESVGAVQPARALEARGGVQPGVLAPRLGDLHRTPRPGASRDRTKQQARAVAMPGERPRPPRDDRLDALGGLERCSAEAVVMGRPARRGSGPPARARERAPVRVRMRAGQGEGMGSETGSISMIRWGRPMSTRCSSPGVGSPSVAQVRSSREGPLSRARLRPRPGGRSRSVR